MNRYEKIEELVVFGRFQQILNEYHKNDKLLKYPEFMARAVYEVGLLFNEEQND